MKSFEYLIPTFIITTAISSGYVMFGGRNIGIFASFYFGASIGSLITTAVIETLEMLRLKRKEREIREQFELFEKKLHERCKKEFEEQ